MKTYYIYKKNFVIKFPVLSFIDETNIKITTFANLYLKIDIEDITIIERFIKISKIKKEENILGDFMIYLNNNNKDIMECIEHLNQIDRDRPKYNIINSGSHPSNNYGDYNGRNIYYDF